MQGQSDATKIQHPVVVADDNQLLLRTIQRVLQAIKVDTVAFSDGDKALAYCQDHSVQLVITDMDMPIKNGLSLIRDLQQRKPLLPVIALSGNQAQLAQALTAGATATVQKPFDAQKLRSVVQGILLPSP